LALMTLPCRIDGSLVTVRVTVSPHTCQAGPGRVGCQATLPHLMPVHHVDEPQAQAIGHRRVQHRQHLAPATRTVVAAFVKTMLYYI
jgi:hypothetical protein